MIFKREYFNCSKVIFYFYILLFSLSSYAQEEGENLQVVQNVVSQGAGGQSFAGTAGVQAQSFTGAVTYNIPIPLPQGTAGFTPSVSINYNHQSRDPNSWVGYGWTLDVGRISRIPNDNKFSVMMSGGSQTVELVERDIDLSEYRIVLFDGRWAAPVIDSADLYRANPDNSYNHYIHIKYSDGLRSAWLVVDKSGTYSYFGLNDESRLASEPQDGELLIDEWYLNSINDSNRNTIVYRYENHHLSQIEYADIQVNFLAGASNVYFPNNNKVRLSFADHARLLERIEIRQTNDDLLQVFHIDYESDPLWPVNHLQSVTQCYTSGFRDEDHCLPSTSFDYNKAYDEVDFQENGSGIKWVDTRPQFFNQSDIRMTAKRGDNIGSLSLSTQIIDMNGDGLVDQIMKNPETNGFTVYFNDGRDFVYIRDKSEWIDPFHNECGFCRGNLSSYHDNYWQRLFLLDINGDSLPDRIYRHVYQNNRSRFRISFNTGENFSEEIVEWEDHHIGGMTGYIAEPISLIDMNGDGLLDRVVMSPTIYDAEEQVQPPFEEGGAECGFRIYYNTGAGFDPNFDFWEDPYNSVRMFDPAGRGMCGRIFAKSRGNLYLTIKDMNGDGYPDRVFRQKKYKILGNERWNEGWNNVTVIIYNQGGKGWKFNKTCEENTLECIDLDGIHATYVLDPQAVNHSTEGYIQTPHRNWIDFNKDGHLDRIIGTTDDYRDEWGRTRGRFHIYYNKGVITQGENRSIQLSEPLVFIDPVRDTIDARNQSGYLLKSDPMDNGILGTHTFIMDMNGDGYPDRVHVKQEGTYFFWDDEIDPDYQVYLFKAPGIQIDQHIDDFYSHPYVNQLPGTMRLIRDGFRNSQSIYYIPSTFRFNREDARHRFLPTPIYHLFLNSTVDFHAQGQFLRPYNRKTFYKFIGGNFYFRKAISADLENPDRENLIQKHKFVFNGFQQMEALQFPYDHENWQAIKTNVYHHQSLGNISLESFPVNNFDQDAYSHYALSGSIYKKETYEGNILRAREKTLMNINASADSDYLCNARCRPVMAEFEKEIFETNSQVPRYSRSEFAYDQYSNLTRERSYDSNGNLLLEQSTEYYPKNYFEDELWIRNRPSRQIKFLANEIFREKTFDYDQNGNPTLERLHTGNPFHPFLDTRKEFDRNGNAIRIYKSTGDEILINYDELGVFIESESRVLSDNQIISDEYTYDRYTGHTLTETNFLGVRKRVVLDNFGRLSEEYLRDRLGDERLVKRYSYDFSYIQFYGQEMRLIVTKVWINNIDYPEMNLDENPSSINYSTINGYTLQSCQMMPNGDYQVSLYRSSMGGRRIVEYYSRIDSNCNFVSNNPENLNYSILEKDFFGRISYIDNPVHDAGSHLADVENIHSVNELGQLVKTVNYGDKTKTEIYDTQERLIEVTINDGDNLRYEYNPVGDLLQIESNNKTVLEYSYDKVGRKISMNHSEKGRWFYEYNEKGLLYKQVDARGAWIEYEYTTNERVINRKVVDENGNLEKETRFLYDESLRSFQAFPNQLVQVEEMDGEGNLLYRNRYGHGDRFGQLEKISHYFVDLGELFQEIDTDHSGQVKTISYPGGHRIYYDYFRTGGIKQICSTQDCDPESSEIYYSINENDFNEDGYPIRFRLGNGVVTEHDFYSRSKRLKRKRVSNGNQVYFDRSYHYDQYSNVTSILDNRNLNGKSGGLKNIHYDRYNRLVSFQFQEQEGIESQDFAYDDFGNMLSSYMSPRQDYRYDAENSPYRLTSIGERNIIYDENGNTISDGKRRFTYDGDARLKKVELNNGNEVEYSYTYAGGRYLKKRTLNRGGRRIVLKNYYLGDGLEVSGDRILLHLHVGNQKVATEGLGTIENLRVAAGSGLNISAINYPSFSFPSVIPYLLFLFSLLTIYLFHPSFYRFLAQPDRAGIYKKILFTFHDFFLVLRSSFEAFFKSPLRHSFILFIIFLIVFQWPFLKSANAQMPAMPQISDEADFLIYYHNDHLGSSSIITEGKNQASHNGFLFDKGELIQRFEYNPYGEVYYTLNPGLNLSPTFTGQQYDDAAGLYYYKSRYYDASLGRFLQADTIIPKPKDTSAYNPYAYVANNPLKYNDPTGHGWKSILANLVALGVAIALSYAIPQPSGVLASFAKSALIAATSTTIRSAIMGHSLADSLRAGALSAAAAMFFSAGAVIVGDPIAYAIQSSISALQIVKNQDLGGFISYGINLYYTNYKSVFDSSKNKKASKVSVVTTEETQSHESLVEEIKSAPSLKSPIKKIEAETKVAPVVSKTSHKELTVSETVDKSTSSSGYAVGGSRSLISLNAATNKGIDVAINYGQILKALVKFSLSLKKIFLDFSVDIGGGSFDVYLPIAPNADFKVTGRYGFEAGIWGPFGASFALTVINNIIVNVSFTITFGLPGRFTPIVEIGSPIYSGGP